MTRSNKTILSCTLPVFIGVMFLLSLVNTCERFPELVLEVTTDSIETLPGRAYKLIGSIESFGQKPVTQHGFCWAETTNPKEDGPTTQLGSRNAKGGFTSIINSLPANTLFYVRAYAITEAGTEYGEEKSFTTPAPTLPIITAIEVSNITQDSAQSGGTITDDGGSEITARGVCWDTISNPTIEDLHTSNGTGTGTFTSSITGLDCSTEYYVRAYATNAAGTSYGNEESFTSASCTPGLPNVTTATISSITKTSAQGGGNVTDEGISSVTARGVCWSESSNPTISDSHTTDGAGLGAYTSSISGLTPNTPYYIRAYSTNGEGTTYGDELDFTTLAATGETVTDYDGNEYNTIQIGEQVWIAENLKVTHFSDGIEIPFVESSVAWDALGPSDKAYCWYDNNTENLDIYGGLYNWYVVNTGKLCPTGWHVPSHDEWTLLTSYLGGESVAGGKLKEAGTSHWINPNVGATNESGFTALPGGSRDSSSGFDFFGYLGFWWSSTEYSTTNARNLALYGDFSGVYNVYDNKESGFSVRCLIDDVTSSLPTITTISASNITASSVQTGGEVVTDGGESVTARGVCWSISENPTLSDEFTTDGLGIGNYTSSLTGLDCNTTYYIRAYATNFVGTAYGNQEELTTSQCQVVNPPTVTTSYLSSITSSSAHGGGEVTDDGGDSITARGVCWNTTQNPTLSDNYTMDGTGAGSFTSNITGLTKSTTYYVRAYATNSVGSSYGEEVILKTYEGTLTDYDGNVYQTVVIGDQTWMQQNLKVTHYEDGTSIPLVEDFLEWVLLGNEDKAYSWYDNSTSYGDIYGGLYTWAAIMNDEASSTTNPSGIQGVCPNGWHLPSDEEWKQLERHLGMSEPISDASDWRGIDEGGKLKEEGAAHWANPNEGATNESGFTALPGGARYPENGASGYAGYLGSWWSCTEYGFNHAWGRFLDYNNSKILRLHDTKEFGYSVRCIEGQGNSVPTIETIEASNIIETSAQSGGNVTDDGGAPVTDRGICWSLTQSPTISDSKTSNGTGNGSFTSLITGLNPGSTYYVRAFATNNVGTAYGEEISFKTLWDNSLTVTDYDGNIYNTIQVGDQVWMQENLKASHYADGTSISLIETDSEWYTLSYSSKAYCWYDNSTSNRDIYGGLYTWAAAMNGAASSNTIPSGIQGVCPAGWHLPSDAEWSQLIETLGGSSVAGGKLKEAGTTHWASPNEGASDESGFTALPGGFRTATSGAFESIGMNASLWSSTVVNTNDARTRFLYSEVSSVDEGWALWRFGYSVRCLKD